MWSSGSSDSALYSGAMPSAATTAVASVSEKAPMYPSAITPGSRFPLSLSST